MTLWLNIKQVLKDLPENTSPQKIYCFLLVPNIFRHPVPVIYKQIFYSTPPRIYLSGSQYIGFSVNNIIFICAGIWYLVFTPIYLMFATD